MGVKNHLLKDVFPLPGPSFLLLLVVSLCPMLTSASGATLPMRIAIACLSLPLVCKLLRSRKALSLSAPQCTKKSLKIYLLNANAPGEEGRLGGRTEKAFRAA